MSRWSREKHRRETAILQSFRDKLKNEIMKTISKKILYGDGRDNEYDDIVMKGSTLIACEQTGRRCYGCEIDPKYVDVIRKRYWKFKTGSEEGWQDGTKAIL